MRHKNKVGVPIMKKKTYLYITFHTTHASIAAEQACKANQIPGRLVLTPRVLTAGCGMSWRSEPEDKELVLKTLSDHQIEIDQAVVL